MTEKESNQFDDLFNQFDDLMDQVDSLFKSLRK
jgi:hypothetical protein